MEDSGYIRVTREAESPGPVTGRLETERANGLSSSPHQGVEAGGDRCPSLRPVIRGKGFLPHLGFYCVPVFQEWAEARPHSGEPSALIVF